MINPTKPMLITKNLMLHLILLVLGVFLTACGNTSEPTPTSTLQTFTPTLTNTPSNTATPTVTPLPTNTPIPTPTPTREVTIQDMQSSTVQIFAKMREGRTLETVWTGSGTIISADGLILTNAHVAAPDAPGLATLYQDTEFLFVDPVDALVVAMVESVDRPPVETYLAEVMAADGVLDLAVIRIVSDLDGNEVDDLSFPYVNVGDSSEVNLGDEVRVLGFPGAGGDTITFTRGDVSGFESQERVGDRAWIKTDTTVSPGNSGGLGANDTGHIIGVPSYVLEAMGGAINRLRSVNLALPLIEAAINNEPYESPYLVGSTGIERFDFVMWARDFDEDGCAIGGVERYNSGTLAVIAIFSYKGLADGEQVVVDWTLDGRPIGTTLFNWEEGERGECYPVYLHNFGGGMFAGTYELEIFVGEDLRRVATVDIEVGRTSVSGHGVQVEGQVTNADTGRPIEGASVFILEPDTDVDDWVDSPDSSAIFTMAQTDSNGNYVLPDPLLRGNEYPGVVLASGYRSNEGGLVIDEDTPDSLVIDLELSK